MMTSREEKVSSIQTETKTKHNKMRSLWCLLLATHNNAHKTMNDGAENGGGHKHELSSRCENDWSTVNAHETSQFVAYMHKLHKLTEQ